MAVRFDAEGEGYTCAFNLGSQSRFTVCCWVKAYTFNSAYVTPVWHVGSTTPDYLSLNLGVVGAYVLWQSNVLAYAPYTREEWRYFGVSKNGGSGTVVSRPATASDYVVSTWSSGPLTVPFSTFRIGQGAYRGEWLDGAIAAVKIWVGTALSQTELEAEGEQVDPVRTSGLTAFYRFDGPSTTDDSGNGWTLSGGVGATQEPGPFGVTVDLADAGLAAETLTVSTLLPLAEVGAGVDLLASTRLIGLTDTGHGDTLPTAAATVPLADAATAGEMVLLGQPVMLTESAAAADALGVSALAGLTEAGAAADALASSALVGLTEAGVGADGMLGGLLLHKVLGDTAGADDVLQAAMVPEIGYIGRPRVRWAAGRPRI
ncbi:MAG: hypothetical protein IRZ07_04205 [Microbispora sp.]|nr:hypothetical protein [Microbispora sp.]